MSAKLSVHIVLNRFYKSGKMLPGEQKTTKGEQMSDEWRVRAHAGEKLMAKLPTSGARLLAGEWHFGMTQAKAVRIFESKGFMHEAHISVFCNLLDMEAVVLDERRHQQKEVPICHYSPSAVAMNLMAATTITPLGS